MSDFDKIEAYGNTIVAERMGETVQTGGGIVIPETSRVPHWIVIAVGPRVEDLKKGERLIFRGGTKVEDPEEGRTFVFLEPKDVLGRLPIPTQVKLVAYPFAGIVDSGPKIQ